MQNVLKLHRLHFNNQGTFVNDMRAIYFCHVSTLQLELSLWVKCPLMQFSIADVTLEMKIELLSLVLTENMQEIIY